MSWPPGRLTEEQADKLRLIVKAREFARDIVGLNVGNSYTTFYDTSGDPLAFNLTAARRDALVAYTWEFPILGEVPYVSFFDENYLDLVEQDLIDQGYDTLTYELDAYSTLGIFEDPVRSPMLRRNVLSLSETIIHELLHNTVWRVGNTVFNESLATFVGRRGAVDFLTAEFGADSGWPETAELYYADLDAVNQFLLRIYDELAAYYAQPLTPEALIADRDAIFQSARDRFVETIQPTLNFPDTFSSYANLPTNNAWMLAHYRYNLDLDLMADIHAATGSNWPATIAIFQQAAQADTDPFEYLRNWLTTQ